MRRRVSSAVAVTARASPLVGDGVGAGGGELLGQLLASLDRRTGGEVLDLEEGAELDLGHLHGLGGDALGPLDRLLARLHLNDPVAGNDLLGLGERTVEDRKSTRLNSSHM